MTLSVVIVNYNVKYFLEQCLISVYNAAKDIDTEVFVVDNASADGSCQMVRDRFPLVKLIENTENHGFSYANNQALRLAKGEFVLILNPDTVVEENTFSKCIEFMRERPEAGSLSVKMIDGKGKFLPESKRSLPSPSVSFYKIFGFSRLFPRSKTFARYHLGHLNPDEVNEIEILPGAFMFIRKTALDKAGLFDESFFMYGEDIDLSYRIIKSGFNNYYFPKTTIIHYKGESTKKGSINYVLVFYRAMMIFARKHFTQKNAFLYIILIYAAIYFRAGLSIAKRIINRWLQPIVDVLVMVVGFIILVPFWENYRFNNANAYSNQIVIWFSSVYIIIWIVSIWFSGGYDKPKKHFAAAQGIVLGSMTILIAYSLLPEHMRFSRAIILLTATWSFVFVQATHLAIDLLRSNYNNIKRRRKRIVIVGNDDESKKVLQILNGASVDYQLVGEVSPETKSSYKNQIGTLHNISEIVRVNSVDEVIFCSANISSQEIIKSMLILVPSGVDFKIAPPDSISVIGSNSIDTSGDLYTIEISAITKPENVRSKRLLDIMVALATIVTTPILYPSLKTHRVMLRKSAGVLAGKLTWVGYAEPSNHQGLPKIKKGVFSSIDQKQQLARAQAEKVNLEYAKNYSIAKDLSIIWRIISKK